MRLKYPWASVIGMSVLVVAKTADAQTYTLHQVDEALAESLDIMKDHVRFLATQDQYDTSLAYYALTYRVAPVRLATNDGQTGRTAFMRLNQNIGVGFGRPRDFSVFGGAWVDIVGGNVPGTFEGQQVAANGLLFLGLGLHGFQLTYGELARAPFTHDLFGNFPTTEAQGEAGGEGRTQAFSAYHSTGASLVVIRTMIEDEWKLAEVRAQLQPLTRWAGKTAGLPMIAVQKLAGFHSYYGDVQGDPTRPSDAQSADLAGTFPSTETPYELEFGSDDLFGEGLRAHLVTRVSPSFALRRGELGWYRDVDRFTFAGRATAFSRADSAQFSGDTFVRFALGTPKRHTIGWPVSVSASYSYNSPETLTFLPLPYAHVFGFQFIVGVPETGKPVVPIVRATEDFDEGGEP
jgi:hypothetical protein